MAYFLRITTIFLVFIPCRFEVQENRISGTYQINSTNTKIEFSAKHFGVLNVDGTFKSFSGQLEIKSSILKSGSLLIKVASITTNNNSRDRSLKSKDFLNPELFPHILLSFEKNINPATVQVNAKIKGVTRPIQLSYKINKSKRLEISCTISRKDFELDFSTMNDLVSDHILVKAELVL